MRKGKGEWKLKCIGKYIYVYVKQQTLHILQEHIYTLKVHIKHSKITTPTGGREKWLKGIEEGGRKS